MSARAIIAVAALAQHSFMRAQPTPPPAAWWQRAWAWICSVWTKGVFV